jgi:hypothetical protein
VRVAQVRWLVDVISIESFGNPEMWKIIGRVVGSKSVVTLTIPVAPQFRMGDRITVGAG